MLISVKNLSKTNGIKKIVDEVSFSIEENDKVALIGINGTGKSTLLKIDVYKRQIVGSAIIKLLEKYGKDAPKYIGEYVKSMKKAL